MLLPGVQNVGKANTYRVEAAGGKAIATEDLHKLKFSELADRYGCENNLVSVLHHENGFCVETAKRALRHVLNHNSLCWGASHLEPRQFFALTDATCVAAPHRFEHLSQVLPDALRCVQEVKQLQASVQVRLCLEHISSLGFQHFRGVHPCCGC